MKDEKELNAYEGLSIKDLILCAFCGLEKERTSFYSILDRCFSLFPTKFCFEADPDRPDARKLGRPLRSLRQEGFVKGDPDQGFSLTGDGAKKAVQIRNRLRQRKLRFKE